MPMGNNTHINILSSSAVCIYLEYTYHVYIRARVWEHAMKPHITRAELNHLNTSTMLVYGANTTLLLNSFIASASGVSSETTNLCNDNNNCDTQKKKKKKKINTISAEVYFKSTSIKKCISCIYVFCLFVDLLIYCFPLHALYLYSCY